MNKGKIQILAAGCLLALAAAACRDSSASYRTTQGATWGTTYHITYKSDRDLADSVVAVMRAIELSLSPFEEASIISRVNRGEPVEVDSMIRVVFEESKRVHTASGGAFDPTLGPLIRLWGFGEDKDVTSEPTQSQIDSALLTVGINECEISDGRIVKKHPDTQFNFSAITKGMGCDQVGEMLRRNGVNDYMVEIGGEVALKGKNPRGEEWHIMVDAPVESASGAGHERLAVMKVTDCGIATSGNYRNYRDYGAKRVGHTINSLTGRPVESATLSATVVAQSTMLADALATSCMAMHPDSALQMIREMPTVSALLVVGKPDGSTTILKSSHFPPLRK